MHYPKDNS